MRKSIRYLVALVVVAFYGGVASTAATPFYGAITSFVHNAASGLGAHATPKAGSVASMEVSDGLHAVATAPAGTRTAATGLHPSIAPEPTSTPTPSAAELRALQVRRLAARSHIPRRRINLLVLGSDNDAKFDPNSVPPTQVIIVLSIDPVSHTLTELSISRDSWVHIPGYGYNTGPDGTVGWSKIQVASQFGFNGTACTVERNFGIPIDNWVWVGLKGFINVVNTLNGVTLDVPNPVLDDEYPDDLTPNDPYAYRRIYIPPGPQHLNGSTALLFVRSRHGDTQSDFSRSQRQQLLINQIRHTLLNGDSASLAALAPSLIQDLKGELETSIAPTLANAAYYWSLLRQAAHYTIKQVVLAPPYSTETQIPDSDPSLEQLNNDQPFMQDALQLNWPLVDQLITQDFGPQVFFGPHCSQ
jgi:LCP family protein required for cell wall assembly